jgi:hypothetical protein
LLFSVLKKLWISEVVKARISKNRELTAAAVVPVQKYK